MVRRNVHTEGARKAVVSLTIVNLAIAANCATAALDYWAGYEPLTDATRHGRIDLDVAAYTSETLTDTSTIGGECSAACILYPVDASKLCGVTTVIADGNGCNYDGTTVAFPSADTTGSAYDTNENGVTLVGGNSYCLKNACKSYEVYLNGQYSCNKGCTNLADDAAWTKLRTVSGFSSGSATKSSGRTGTAAALDVDFKDNNAKAIMNTYWKAKFGATYEHAFGDLFTKAAYEGSNVPSTGTAVLDFSAVGRTFRKEAISKGSIYLNIYPYVIWEMQDQVNDCKANAVFDNDGSNVLAWDEAVAFYTGSKLQNTESGNPTSVSSKLQYALADKRCGNFRTCANGWSGVAKVNQQIMELFHDGKELVPLSGTVDHTKCAEMDVIKNKITTLMLVPFIQGTMRYLYKTKTVAKSKEAGELWAFASAILPFLHQVDPSVAQLLYDRAWNLNYDGSEASYQAIKTGIEGTLTRLGVGKGIGLITCESIGDLYGSSVEGDIDAAGCSSPSSSSSNNDTVLGLGIGIPLGAIAITALVFVVFLWRKSSANSKRVEELTVQLRGAGRV